MTNINNPWNNKCCAVCRQATGCAGLQYDHYTESWYCPVFTTFKLVYDKETTMNKDAHVGNGTNKG